MKPKDRIDEINRIKGDLNQEIESLQNECPHQEYYIGTYSWRAGCFEQMRICNDCYKLLGGPTTEELKDFNQEIDQLNPPLNEPEKSASINGLKTIYVKPLGIRFGRGTKIYKNG